MACEPIPNCETCTGSTEELDCTRLRAMRCKLAAQLDAILCAPAGPVEIEGLRFESRSAAIESLTKAIDWTILRCSEIEGAAIESSSAVQCGGRDTWWGSCR